LSGKTHRGGGKKMNNKPMTAVLWILGLLALAACFTAGVAAMGAPTENYTITDLPGSSSGYPPIQPSVNFILEGPTSQTDNTSPAFIADFVSPSGNGTVTGNESWYLDIDINSAGWLYIYEYYPPNNTQGQWIAYKWQLPESGQWRLGPFSPSDNETEGQHIYRIWFYNDGQWATEEAGGPRDNLVYWTYVKSAAVSQVPSQPTSTAQEEASPTDQLYNFFTNSLIFLLGGLILGIVIAVFSYRIYRRRRVQPVVEPKLIEPDVEELVSTPEIPVTAAPQAAARAKLSMPNGMEIPLATVSKIIGRGELARALALDDLGLISRKHFVINLDGSQFSIEDNSSANGTLLNGIDIKGKGPVDLNDEDNIEPAGAIKLKFHLL
jgi:hypothetical protein